MRNLIFAALLSSTALVPGVVQAQENNQQLRQQSGQEQRAGERQVRAIELVSMPVVDDQNQRAGTVAGVVERDQQQYVVIETAQERNMVMVEIENVRMQGGQLALSAASLRSGQPWRDDMQSSYTPVPEQEPVTLAAMQQGGQGASQETQGALITVEQQPAQVMVEQQPPQIIVRQAPPTIIVQQPQPEIIVRMPEPQVSVNQQQPQVQIEQPEPEVQTNQAQAMVSTQQAQPQVTFERTGEPQVQFQEEQGQPKIRVERMQAGQQQAAQRRDGQQQSGSTQQAAGQRQAAQQSGQQQQAGQEQQQAGAQGFDQERVRQAFEVGGQQQQGASGQRQQVAASDLAGMQVYNGRGETLGRVDRVLQDPTQRDRHYLLMQTDQSFGFDQNQAILPLERVSMQDNRLVVSGVTESDLEAMQVSGDLSAYPQVAQGEMVNVGATP